MNVTQEIMIGLAIGGGLGWLSTAYVTMRSSGKNRLLQIDNFNLQAEKILNETCVAANAANAVLLYLHNSGGQITPGTQIYSSVLKETPSKSDLSVAKNWSGIEIDESYFALMVKLQKNSRLLVRTSEMQSGLLKRTYESYGITGSVVFSLFSTDYCTYYVSFPIIGNIDKVYESKNFVEFEYAQQKLIKLLKKCHKQGVIK